MQSARLPWETHWRDIAVYALPDAERYDQMFAGGSSNVAIDAVVSTPIAAERSRAIYDMTSLWAVDRGAAGTLSLVTPQSGTWHDMTSSDPFGGESGDDEDRWYEVLRDYLFATRANPRSGFWTAHKAAMRCVWGFGTAVVYLEEHRAGISSPISYRFIPLSENHLATNFEGVIDTNYRLFTRTARQCVERWGSNVSAKVREMADKPKEKDKPVRILHAVYPRQEQGSRGNYGRDMQFASCYVEVDQKHLIGEGGYTEFPYRVDHWQRNNPGPYAEGPIALALADVKSLNMLAKGQLRATAQWTDPALATPGTFGEGTRINLNPRAVNPGYVSPSGDLLVKPIITAQRPDFAETVLEAKRNQVRTTLYIDVWTSIINSPREMTAYEVMIKANEKGDLLGPVGSSLQTGLSFMVDREVGILARMGAFEPGARLAPPDSVRGKAIGVRFTSPLDRMRKIAELQGLQHLWTFAAQIAQAEPAVLDKLDADESIDFAQEVLGAPRRVMTKDADLEQRRNARATAENTERGITTAAGAGQAATVAAEGAQSIANSPAAAEVLKRIAGVTGIPAQ